MNKMQQIIKNHNIRITPFEQDLIDYIEMLEKALIQFRWDERKLNKIIKKLSVLYLKGDD